MPDNITSPTTTPRQLTDREWELIQLIREQPAHDAEYVHVPAAFYRVMEDAHLRLQDQVERAAKHAAALQRVSDTFDYLTGQLRTVTTE
jgi:hypothetical protein